MCRNYSFNVLTVTDPAKLIKKFGLETCLPAISIYAPKLVKAIGTLAAKKISKTNTGDRKFQSLKPL